MGQSLTQIYIHAVFGTKTRAKLIHPEIEEKLHSYISGVLKELGCPCIEINSTEDHIHILFRLSKNQAISMVLKEIKRSSSLWMKTKGVTDFYWQIGYGAFSVSSFKVDVVQRYIQNQKEHHAKLSFKDEVEKLVSEYKLNKYDENYFWND